MPARVESTSPLPGLSPIAGKPLIARFDGGKLSSDGGLLALREVERRLGLADRLAACIDGPRAPERVRHGIAAILRFRMLMIAVGCEDGNDADGLRHDPIFKLALDHLPDGAALCSQPTISRLENLPGPRALLRMARAMVGLYCTSFRQVPRRIVLDADDTCDAVHVGQQLRLFNVHHDGYGFQPIVVFDGEGRPVATMLRPARRPSGCEARAFLRRLVREIRGHWPRVEILIRADSHYCPPEMLDLCRAEGLDFVLGVASTTTLRRHVEALERSTAARRAATPGIDKLRRHRGFYDGAGSWSRVERIVVRVEAGPEGVDTRCVVTSLTGGSAPGLHERKYRKRGHAENHIKAWKLHLAADRTSCSRATADQSRLLLHTAAYWLMWPLRSLMPKRSTWHVAQCDTLRLRLQTLRDWVHRYNAEGLAGLSDRPQPGPKPRLAAEQEAEVAGWVEARPDPAEHGVVRWRRADLRGRIAERFGVRLHERSVGKLLARLRFWRLSPRPRHPGHDPAAQASFGATSPPW